jgi:hypothetical protein
MVATVRADGQSEGWGVRVGSGWGQGGVRVDDRKSLRINDDETPLAT